MAHELTVRGGGASAGPAPTGAEATTWTLTRVELRRFVHSWRLWLLIAIVVFPSVLGLVQAPGYRLVDNFDLFGLLIEGWFPLLFVLLVVMLYLPGFSGQLSHGFIRQARTRAGLGDLLTSRIIAAALIAFAMGFVAIAVPAVIAFGINAQHGLVDVSGFLSGETVRPITTRTTFSRLYADPPVVFSLAFATWVGINGALWAVIGGLAQIVIGNRFLALAAAPLLYWGFDIALALRGLAGYGLGPSIFQTNVVQQPVWAPFIQFGVLSAATAVTAWWVSRRPDGLAGLG